MLSRPKMPEIDHRTIKLIVGLIALTLANITSFFANNAIESISASYYADWPAQNIFIGFLYAISVLMLSYNGLSVREMVLSKIAALLALGVAIFPCRCKQGKVTAVIAGIHYTSAAILFLILAYFCYLFCQRARQKGHKKASARASIYIISGIAILASVVVLATDHFGGGFISASAPRLVFYGERTGWLTASRILPFLARDDERLFSVQDQERYESRNRLPQGLRGAPNVDPPPSAAIRERS